MTTSTGIVNGIVNLSDILALATINEMSLQTDGKILLAGSLTKTSGSNTDFLAVRLNTDGTLDTTFNGVGWTRATLGSYSGVANNVLVNAAGQIYLTGTQNSAVYPDIGVARLNANGALDTNFSGDGLVVTSFSDIYGYDIVGKDSALQADGKLVIAGYGTHYASATSGIYSRFLVVRYNADGSYDSSFTNLGDPGIVSLKALGTSANNPGEYSIDKATCVAIDSAGRILVAGPVGYSSGLAGAGGSNATAASAIVRLTSNGAFDTSFGSGTGISLITTNFGTNGSIEDMVVQSDGKILVAGTYTSGTNETSLYISRLTASGEMDSALNGTSVLYTNIKGNAADIALDSSGRILLSAVASNGQFVLARYLSNGTLDASFNGGVIYTDVTSAADISTSVVVNPDGTVWVAGYNNLHQLILTKYENNGQLSHTNSTPTGDVTIIGQAVQGNTLTANNTLADADGLGTITYQWNSDGSPINGAIGSSYTLTAGNVGHLISVTASYTDTLGTHEALNSAPTSAVAATSSNTPSVTNVFNLVAGQTATAVFTPSSFTLVGNSSTAAQGMFSAFITANQAGAFQVEYWQNASDPSPYQVFNSPFVSSGGLNLWTDREGKVVIRALQNVSVDVNSVSVYTGSAQYTIADTALQFVLGGVHTNSLPTGDVSLSGSAAQGVTLTAISALADADGMGSLSYRWTSDGALVSTVTGANYLLTQADVGHRIAVSVSYVDGYGTTESVSSAPTASVANVNDLPTGGVSIAGSPMQGQVLTANNTLADLDGLGTISYQWKIDGNNINAATGSTYTVKLSDVGHKISVAASYIDGGATLETVTSAQTALISTVGQSSLGGVSYFWNYEAGKGHALLSGVNVTGQVDSTPSASPVVLKNVLWDASGHVTAEVWLHATTTVTSYDIDLFLAQATGSATFTPAAGAPTGFLPISYFDASTHHLKASGAGLTGYASGDFKLADVSFDVGATATAVAISMASDRVNTLTGDAFDIVMTKAITGSNGAYAFDALPSGTYHEQATRSSADGASAVNSLDALAALKMAVSLNPNTDPDGAGAQAAPATSAYQYIAADVAGNSGNTPDGKVTAADALAILKMAVGMPSAPTANWVLLAENANLSGLSKDNVAWDNTTTATVSSGSGSTLNFVGVVKGDVNGSWAAPTGSQYLETTDPSHFTTLAQSLSVQTSQWQIV